MTTRIVPHPLIATEILSLQEAAAKDKKEKDRLGAEKKADIERVQSYREKLRPASESGSVEKIHTEHEYFDVGLLVELKLQRGKWQPGVIKSVITTNCNSWRDFDVPSGESKAFVIVAYDLSGEEYILGFNGKNCDPLPSALVSRFLKKKKTLTMI